MVRKQGKLPNSVSGAEYFKEYQGVSASGGDTLCAPRNVIPNGARVLVIDDLMATGVRLSYLPLLT
jgi:adenine/guanine phosphoribosyltransferase-like PRPP-binding protein